MSDPTMYWHGVAARITPRREHGTVQHYAVLRSGPVLCSGSGQGEGLYVHTYVVCTCVRTYICTYVN